MMTHQGTVRPRLTEELGLPTDPMPTRLYTDPVQYEAEREKIFGRAWLMVGRQERIPDPGDFFVKDIAALNASIIITRIGNDRIKAFHNVCSHRGNRIVLASEGNAGRFTCRYHAWTYKNSGELIGMPDQAGFFDLDKKKCGLTPIHCDQWDGWIFINFQPAPETTLQEFLGPLGKELSSIPYPFPENPLVMSGHVKANWKAVGDNFAEPYHVPTIHPKTLAPVYAGAANPGTRPVSATVWGPHRGIGVWMNTAFTPGDGAKVASWVMPADQTVTGASSNLSATLADHPGINVSNSTEWASDDNWIFPNLNLQLSPNRFWTHEFWPTARDSTYWEHRFYQPRPTTVRERIQLEHFTATIADTFLEDLDNIESTQQGMDSGAKPFVHLHDSEIQVRHNLLQVMKWTGANSARQALDLDT
jgi:glycine betaine catabolism A